MLASLARWSRSASILAAVLLILRIALPSVLGTTQGTSNPYEIYSLPLYVLYNLLLDVALLLFVVGLVGLHAHQAKHFRQLGKTALFLASIAAVLLIVSAFAAGMVGVTSRGLSLFAPLVLFTQLLAGFCLVVGLVPLSLAALREVTLQNDFTPSFHWSYWISNIHWREALLILGAGLGAAFASHMVEGIVIREFAGLSGPHLLHVLMTIPVAAWVARKLSVAPILSGVIVGVISGTTNQVYFHGLAGTLKYSEVIIIITSSVAAGSLGGLIARSTLADKEILYRASQAIKAAQNRQDVVDAIGQHLSSRQVSHVALWEVASTAEDDNLVEIELQAAWRPPAAREIWGPEIWQPGLRINAAQIPALERGLRQNSQQVIRVKKLPDSEQAAWKHQGINSFILLPLTTSSETPTDSNETKGTRMLMIASSKITGFLSKGAENTYQTVGAQAALALENLRLVEQAQQTGVSQERQRLAHEIHDTLAQGFTSIVMKLEAAEETLAHNPTAVQRYIDQARRTARESLQEARQLMWALRSKSLEETSLATALNRLVERYSEECSATANLTVVGTPRPLSPEIEVTLLRIAQEALSNCRKHARASQVSVTLSYMNNLVLLNIEDNGVGFDPARPRTQTSEHSGGFGLNGMRRRVAQLSGTLLLDSTPGVGTTLMVALPVAGDKQPNQNNARPAKKTLS